MIISFLSILSSTLYSLKASPNVLVFEAFNVVIQSLCPTPRFSLYPTS
ncbi:hypothetical protein [Aliarcobacter butzleri]|nr:hypothetical protein [Aliarcobacter butzleri]